jgi:hypothetical protein
MSNELLESDIAIMMVMNLESLTARRSSQVHGDEAGRDTSPASSIRVLNTQGSTP